MSILPQKRGSNSAIDAASFIKKANKKPQTKKGKQLNLYVSFSLHDRIDVISTSNNVSKTVVLKALLAAFDELNVNEQNRLLFDAIRDRLL